jgi:hypothetical protein
MNMTQPPDTTNENIWLGRLGTTLTVAGGLTGVASLTTAAWIAWSTSQQPRFFLSYLNNFMFFLSLALGGLFLLLLEHLVHAGWSVVLRRLTEWIVASLAWLALLFIPILFALDYLYPWTHPNTQPNDHLRALLAWKTPYLNMRFFSIRVLIYFAAWLSTAWFYLRQSMRQDRLRDLADSAKLSLRMETLAPPAMILFALTVTFAAFDWLMSRDPFWYSTIYGVYYFSGCVVGAFALLTTIAFLLQTSGRLRNTATPDHYQDLGKYTFGFIVFWAYIAFSQYMLIWYGNIPEETQWYLRRQTGQWACLSVLLILGHFFIPFFALLSRYPKRRPALLVPVCLWILLMHWLDICWLTMPESSPAIVPLSWLDLLTFLGIGGISLAGASHWQRGQPLVPVSDRRLTESLRFENA